jgi:microcystin-dependent protein
LPRSSGTYNLPAGNPVVNGTPISSASENSTLTDIANELTNSLPRDGTAPPTANIPMGSFKLTGLANGTLAQDAVTLSQLQAGGSQWLTSGVTPTFVNTTSFTLAGDQTGQFQVGRRLKLTETAGTVYGYILTSIFISITTVTVVLDSGVLDSGLNQVQYGILTPNNSSIPSKLTVQSINTGRASIVQNATTMDLFALSNIIDGTGSAVTITAIVNAPQAGATRTLYPITSTVIVNNAMFALDGGANYTTQAGDKVEFEAITISTYKVHITKANGAAMTGAGEYFYWPIGSTPVYGLSCNGAAVSRTVYQALFGIIGTVFGVGDGSTTFNIPNIPADYSFVQASANEASSTVGQVLAHTHGILQYQATGGGASAANATATGAVTTTTSAQTPAGGVANFAAGVRVRICIRF